MGPNPPWVALSFYASSQSVIVPWDWGKHTMRCGVDPGYLYCRPQGVGAVDMWTDGNTDLSSPDATEQGGGCPERQLSSCTLRPLIGEGRAGGALTANGVVARKRKNETHMPVVSFRVFIDRGIIFWMALSISV